MIIPRNSVLSFMRLVDAASMPLTHDTSLARCSSRDPRRLCSAIGIRANLSRREVALPCSGAFATFRQRVRFVRRPLLGSRGRRRNWGSGYRAKITLTSSSSTPTTGWTVGVSLDGGDFTAINLAWLNWWLKDDVSATGKGRLVGAGCPYCDDAAWEYRSANIP
jgi:hypothetical protein